MEVTAEKLTQLEQMVADAEVQVEEHYDFYVRGCIAHYIGDVTIDAEGRAFSVALGADHMDIEPLLEARAKQIKAEREGRCAKLEAALRFYADRNNWSPQPHLAQEAKDGDPPIWWSDARTAHDTGEIARKALKKEP